MGTSSRDLRVRFVGDAASLQGTFQEVAAGAQQAQAGLHTTSASAENVGKTFTKTGKVFKSTGKLLKSSGLDAASAGAGFLSTIPALSGMAAGAGGLVTQLDSLSAVAGSLGPVGLPILAAAAVAAGAAFVIFRDRVGAATEALNIQKKVNEELAEQHRKTGQAVTAHQDAVTSLRGAHLSLRSAAISLEEADKAVAKAQKESGKGSLEYRAALVAQAQAQEQVRTSRQEVIRQSVDALRTTKASAKAIDDEVVATRAAADEARRRAILLRLSGINGKDAAAANTELKKTLNAEQKAAAQSASKHRDNAQRAREMADAIGTATPRAKVLHDKLLELSRTELNTAAQVAAINAITSAADSASAGVANVVSWLQTLNSTPGPSSRGGGGGGRPKKSGGPGGQTADALPGRRNPLRAFRLLGGDRAGLTPQDRADAAIAARHRDDSLQDKRVGAKAIADAKAGGITNPDKLQAKSDLAVAKVRKAELVRDIARIRSAVKKVEGQIKTARKKLADQRAKRRTAKKDDQAKLDAAIDATRQRISGLWDQHRALVREGNETVADAKELGFDIKQLQTDIKGMGDSVPAEETGAGGAGDEGPTQLDFLNAAVAEAALTPGNGDDIAAADALVAYWQDQYAQAKASGDPRRIQEAAQALKDAQDSDDALKANTEAVQANTDAITQAFGGSSVFSYRGQDYALRLSPPSSDRLVGAEVGL